MYSRLLASQKSRRHFSSIHRGYSRKDPTPDTPRIEEGPLENPIINMLTKHLKASNQRSESISRKRDRHKTKIRFNSLYTYTCFIIVLRLLYRDALHMTCSVLLFLFFNFNIIIQHTQQYYNTCLNIRDNLTVVYVYSGIVLKLIEQPNDDCGRNYQLLIKLILVIPQAKKNTFKS